MKLISLFQGYQPQVQFIRMSNTELRAAWMKFVNSEPSTINLFDLNGAYCELVTRAIPFYDYDDLYCQQ